MHNDSRLRLLAVCLGGRAPGCNVELHDVVFTAAGSLEAAHPRLLDLWFGEPDGLHVDAWTDLDQVPGYRVHLSRQPPTDSPRLYFVNIGGYKPGEFGERHAYGFLAAASVAEVKRRAKQALLPGKVSVHRDDLYDIDQCLQIDRVDGLHVHLVADPGAGDPIVTNGYFPLPRATIHEWKSARGRS